MNLLTASGELSVTLVDAPYPGSFQTLLFTVPLTRRSPVFMSRKVYHHSEDQAVVILDPAKFLLLWRNEPDSIHTAIANGNPTAWRKDYKFHWATDGFGRGRDNPVPIAEVSLGLSRRTRGSGGFLWFGRVNQVEETPYVAVGNVTRTIWLLAHDCPAMPVCCELPGADLLHRLASVPGAPFHTVSELAQLLK